AGWQTRSFSAQKGDFNHFEYKLCETKPNSEMQEMNLTSYIANRYEEKSGLPILQKQSQTNPKQPQNLLNVRGAKPNQSQSNPNLSATPFGGLDRPRNLGENRAGTKGCVNF
ncbi:MAG: hypothetical protein JW947_05575, partial [Sedimentisphaerales bacterium]|nr:hypothetical protein [Sedimentisphaerales bacterium]